jgi:hypothetical protein
MWTGIFLAHCRAQWRALVNTVMKFSNSITDGKFLDDLTDC